MTAFRDAIVGVNDDYVMYNALTPLKARLIKGFVKTLIDFYDIETPVYEDKPVIGIIERVSNKRYCYWWWFCICMQYLYTYILCVCVVLLLQSVIE